MKRSSAELKEMARNHLAGKWGIVVGFTALELLITTLLSCIPLPLSKSSSSMGIISYMAATLIVSLISSLFAAGSAYFFLNISRGQEYRIKDLFAAFKMHPDRFLIVALILTLAQTVFEIPSFVLSFSMTAENKIYYTMLSSLCTLAGSIVFLILSLFFVLSTYLLLDYPGIGAIDSMKLSAFLMRGNKGRCFYISLSFLGWIFLALISCGIGMLWIIPYMSMTQICFYTDILEQVDGRDSEHTFESVYHN